MFWTRLFPAAGARARSTRAERPTPALRVEQLEDRSVPAATAFAFTPNSFGGGSFNPFPGFNGPVETTSGDVNGDGVADIIAAQGAGAGSTSEVRVFDGAAARNGQAVLIADFYAYSNTAGAGQAPGFAGGVYVAAADLTGDGTAQLVTTTGAGGQGHLKVFDFRDPTTGQFLGNSPTLLTSFYVYPGFQGAVQVAAINRGAGTSPLVVTASGAGTTASDVRVFDNAATIGGVAPGALVSPAAQTLVYPGYLGGVSLAAGGSVTNPQLYVAPLTANPLVSTFGITGTGAGGLTLAPGISFPIGTGSPSVINLASADLTGTGTLDVLTSYGNPGGAASPISVYSLATGVATPVPNELTGFDGFGFFNGQFLSAGAFAVPALNAGTTAAGLNTGLNTGLNAAGTTTAVGGTNTGLNSSNNYGQSAGVGASTGTGLNTTTPSGALNTGLNNTGTSTGLNTGASSNFAGYNTTAVGPGVV
jgi:hypothetical protein